MSTKLPALVPFNDPVTVCGACGKAACLQSNLPKIRCAAHKAGPVLTKRVPLAQLQAHPLEHSGYWKGDPRRDPDMPIDLVDLHELVRDQRKRARADERDVVRSYLLCELRIDRHQVAEAFAAEWPEEAVAP